MEKILKHPIIGEVKIVKGGGGSSIRLSVHIRRGVRVSIPRFASFTEAERFIESRIDWITAALIKQRRRADRFSVALGEGEEILTLSGVIKFLRVDSMPGKKIKISVKGVDRIISYHPDATKEDLKDAVIKILRKDAKEYLPSRLETLARQHGFIYNKLFLKNNTSNWGSCSSKSNINLNIHLMRLPYELCDYIILHELCHLKYRNHGEKFHKLVNELCGGNEREITKELLKFRPEL
ncbi:MAG: SprT family zinc-dependent metalloprotease [Bacteroidales bacterium]|nr:SprT family zinc-dependent metalloprotease [Bacteroidales bacterium]